MVDTSIEKLAARIRCLSDEELAELPSLLSMYLDDNESEIKKLEKREGKLVGARERNARLTKLVYTKLIPESLCGKLQLMNGEVIEPTN